MKNTTFQNNHGIALLIALGILLFLSIITSASFIRYGAEKNISNRERALMQAFYNAEEGLNYAYGELAYNDYNWQTHTWDNNTLKPTSGITSQFGGSFNNDGLYSISGHHFQVITYLELNKTTKIPTGVIVIHSRATDPQGKVTRTVELRVSKNSLFDYFYFFPNDHTFSGGTYDGAGYGKIHVNGKIILSGNPTFKNIIELSSANAQNNGYFILYNSQYGAPKNYDGSIIDGIASLSRSSSPPYDYSIGSDFYSKAKKFTSSSAAAKIDTITIPSTLDLEWSWDKYAGDQASDEQAISFQVSNDALGWLVSKYNNPTSSLGPILSTTEYETFKASADLDAFWNTWWTSHPEYAGTTTTGELAKKFWHGWLGDTPSYINDEWWSDLTYGNDRAASETISVNYLNTKEQTSAWQSWLEGKTASITKFDTGVSETKSLSSIIKDGSNGGQYLVPIKLETNYKKQAENGGIAITKNYNAAYTAWLNQPRTLIFHDETITFTMNNYSEVQSAWLTQHDCGGRRGFAPTSSSYPDPSLLILVIGPTPPPTQPSTICGEFLNVFWLFISSIYQELQAQQISTYKWDIPKELNENKIVTATTFYNPVRQPGVYDSQNEATRVQNADPTVVLDIDVAKLRDYLQDSEQAFNGVIYVESTDASDTDNDFSVRVQNGGILPENGLTLVTPHNIIVQGSFNLDYERDKENKTAAESEAYDYYQSQHQEQSNNSDYKWRPAALISSQRMIYTVSDNFQKDQAINSLADISSYNYWNTNESDYPYSLQSSYFIDNYLNTHITDEALAKFDSSRKYRDYCDAHGLSYNRTWSVSDITNLLDKKNLGAGDAQSVLLNIGEGQYDSTTEATQPNRVLKDIIYNTAMVSPYDPEGYILERWIGADGVAKKRQITGSLIQLEDKYRASVPFAYYIKNQAGQYVYQIGPGYDYNSSYHYGYNSHGYIPQYSGYIGSSFYNYEPNFAKEDSASGPIAAAVGSWFEISNNNFYPEY